MGLKKNGQRSFLFFYYLVLIVYKWCIVCVIRQRRVFFRPHNYHRRRPSVRKIGKGQIRNIILLDGIKSNCLNFQWTRTRYNRPNCE